jgi:cell division protein FtsI (penicillin-binding protein 3)
MTTPLHPKRRTPARGGWRSPKPGRTTPEMDAALIEQAGVRGRWAFVALAACVVAILVKAGWVMAVPDERLEARGREQFRFAVDLRGRRGALVDRNDRVLAATVNLPSLYANPSRLPPTALEERVAAIVALTGRSEEWVRGRFAPRGGQLLQEVKLGAGLDPDDAARIIAGLPRDQMWLLEEPVRVYPGRELAAPLLGFTDAFDDGAAGLERILDKELAGDTVRVLQEKDRKGRVIDGSVDTALSAGAGNTVRLTIDASIQFATERALDEVMGVSAPEAATAVVLDVHTGAVLAMATRPTGNPNDTASRIDQGVFKNRSAMDQLEPGSVFKPFVAAAAMEEGLVTEISRIDCENGGWTVGGKTIRDDHPKGVISVTEVIKYSSNVGAAKLGFMLGAEKTLRYLSDFGFGRRTGLGLPGEVSGVMRSAASIKPIELATTSFGQGVTASPVQLAAGVAVIANGGLRMTPRLVDAVLDRHGEVEMTREPREDRRVISERTARAVARMMETVSEPGGTGTRARVPGYRVAGKTGTAQKVENGGYSATKRVSTYTGFLPADRPEVAIVVVVDTPTIGSKYGGIAAAPAFSSIGAFTMRYLGIAPDPDDLVIPPAPGIPEVDPEAPPPAPRVAKRPEPFVSTLPSEPIEVTASAEGWVVPDLTGRSLRAALVAMQPIGVDLKVEGSGRVASQEPLAGTAVGPGDRVTLHLN